jgi:hypothetical protein
MFPPCRPRLATSGEIGSKVRLPLRLTARPKPSDSRRNRRNAANGRKVHAPADCHDVVAIRSTWRDQLLLVVVRVFWLRSGRTGLISRVAARHLGPLLQYRHWARWSRWSRHLRTCCVPTRPVSRWLRFRKVPRRLERLQERGDCAMPATVPHEAPACEQHDHQCYEEQRGR